MGAFLLVLIAAIAATSVSCRAAAAAADVPISGACNTSSAALDTNPNVNLGESYIIKTGCTKLNFNDDYIKNNCAEVGEEGFRRCACETTLVNTSFWETAVNMSSGRSCYIDLAIVLTGTEIDINNQTRPTEVTNTHYNFGLVAVGNACNKTEIEGALLVPFANEGLGFVDSSLNANSNVSGVTWTSGSVTVTACGVSSPPVTKTIPSSNTGGTTTTPPTTPTPSGSSSNSNSTSAPTTTVPPVTPAPANNSSSSSSSSSTGGKGTGTGTGNGNGASSTVMVHSTTAVMIALISAAVGVAVITTA